MHQRNGYTTKKIVFKNLTQKMATRLIYLKMLYHVLLTCLLCQIALSEFIEQCDSDSEECHRETVNNYREPSSVVRVVRGRLGNHLWGYFMALGMQKELGLRVLVTRETKESLSR